MKFCPNCKNKLFFKENEGKLYEHCKSCGYEVETTEPIVSSSVYQQGGYDDPTTRRYMRYSPTLERTIHQQCPNTECPSRQDESLQEAVIINVGHTLKKGYICVVCNTEFT